ncbi:Conserved hypothetical protein [Capnocytophaga canimorsus Cc5]|uniref:DUF7660 domain-containing protein n=1 Tax=Capnocytophaga canimorsus (strain 5) TaxID=860228 RepID=F9YVY2_CAPCC|nr:hypothetical protein [Capnocytophaga canimorsus]AEK24485.1 Conserved hypothetical protein [Capnocytophaga canimorsus Cc5]
MNSNIHQIEVNTREDFAKFLEMLKNNLEHHPQDWENTTLPDFLDALSRYTEDVQQYYVNTNQHIDADIPNWSVFADIFKGAMLYE